MEVQVASSEPISLIEARSWAYSMDVGYDYATEILGEIPILIKTLDSSLTEVFTGHHPTLGALVMMICATGHCHLKCQVRPISRQSSAQIEDQIILKSECDLSVRAHRDKNWKYRFVVSWDDAVRLLLGEREWVQTKHEMKLFQIFDVKCPRFGTFRLFLVAFGDSYLYAESLAAVQALAPKQ